MTIGDDTTEVSLPCAASEVVNRKPNSYGSLIKRIVGCPCFEPESNLLKAHRNGAQFCLSYCVHDEMRWSIVCGCSGALDIVSVKKRAVEFTFMLLKLKRGRTCPKLEDKCALRPCSLLWILPEMSSVRSWGAQRQKEEAASLNMSHGSDSDLYLTFGLMPFVLFWTT